MKGNIGIITLNGYKNYGNRLQNYALQEYLKCLGYSVETILVDNKEKNIKSTFHRNAALLRNKILNIFSSRRKLNNINEERKNKFINFSEIYINETQYKIRQFKEPIGKLGSFDYFVVGSDQVWNPHYVKNNGIYFLTFAPKNKRIAYAPSFGISEIPAEYKETYSNMISNIKSLSVREEDGAKIIRDLTSREAPILLDPTLLLTKEKWMTIMKESPNKPTTSYILTYFLGDLREEDTIAIENLANKYNLKVINMANVHDLKYYTADPSEFLDYIKTSTLFLTDSFHGVVFSILLEKPFLVFERIGKNSSMYSRIETLLKKFNLKEREWHNLKNIVDPFNVDYQFTDNILEEEREKSRIYLERALKEQ